MEVVGLSPFSGLCAPSIARNGPKVTYTKSDPKTTLFFPEPVNLGPKRPLWLILLWLYGDLITDRRKFLPPQRLHHHIHR